MFIIDVNGLKHRHVYANLYNIIFAIKKQVLSRLLCLFAIYKKTGRKPLLYSIVHYKWKSLKTVYSCVNLPPTLPQLTAFDP